MRVALIWPILFSALAFAAPGVDAGTPIGPEKMSPPIGTSFRCPPTSCPSTSGCPGGCMTAGDTYECSPETVGGISGSSPCAFGGSASASASFNRRNGSVAASGGACFDASGAFGSVSAVDRFTLVGPAGPNAINFVARLSCGGSGTAHLETETNSAIDLIRGSLILQLSISHPVGEAFFLAYGVTGASLDQTGGGAASGSLTFTGLPATYGIVSCHGFTAGTVPVQGVTWGRVKSHFR